MSLPHVIATDLDGTLYGPTGEVSERNRRALSDAVAAGVRVVILTARPPRTTALIDDGLDYAAISCGNGAYTLIPGEEPLVHAIDGATSAELVGKLRGCLPKAAFGVETGTDFYRDVGYQVKPWWPQDWATTPFEDADTLVTEISPVVKLLAQSADMELPLMYEAAIDVVGSLAEVTYSGATGNLELSASGVSKGNTLAMLCRRWGVAPEDVVAFGDMPNDHSALTWAGTGYVMSNGHPDLFDPAIGLRVAPHADEDGVGQVIERLLRG